MLSEVKRIVCPELQSSHILTAGFSGDRTFFDASGRLPDGSASPNEVSAYAPRRHRVKIRYLRRVIRPVNVAPDRMYGSPLMTVSAIFRPLSSFGYPTRIGVQPYRRPGHIGSKGEE